MGRTIGELLKSVHHNGLVSGSKAARLGGIGSYDMYNSSCIGTVPINPIFTDDRSIYHNPVPEEIYNSVELSDMNNVWDWDNNRYAMIKTKIGAIERKVIFARSANDEEMIQKVLAASSDELSALWLDQVLYERFVGLVEISMERMPGSKEADEPAQSKVLNSVLFMMPIDNVQMYALSKVSSGNMMYHAGEIALEPPIPDCYMAYILVPERISSSAKDAGFAAEVKTTGYLGRETMRYGMLEMPDYESVIRQILSDDKRQFLAHIMRLPVR